MRLRKCKNIPCECAIKIKVDKVKAELKYLEKVFAATYQRFLTAIDLVDYHPTQTKPELDRPSDQVKHNTEFIDTEFACTASPV